MEFISTASSLNSNPLHLSHHPHFHHHQTSVSGMSGGGVVHHHELFYGGGGHHQQLIHSHHPHQPSPPLYANQYESYNTQSAAQNIYQYNGYYQTAAAYQNPTPMSEYIDYNVVNGGAVVMIDSPMSIGNNSSAVQNATGGGTKKRKTTAGASGKKAASSSSSSSTSSNEDQHVSRRHEFDGSVAVSIPPPKRACYSPANSQASNSSSSTKRLVQFSEFYISFKT